MSTSVLWDFSVLSAWECLDSSLSLVMFFTTCKDTNNNSCHSSSGFIITFLDMYLSSNLSEGFSLILFASILGNLLQGCSPLGPLFHFDQAGQQTNQQKESYHAQKGDYGHIQWLQLVGCIEVLWEKGEKNRSGRINNSTDLSLTYWIPMAEYSKQKTRIILFFGFIWILIYILYIKASPLFKVLYHSSTAYVVLAGEWWTQWIPVCL